MSGKNRIILAIVLLVLVIIIGVVGYMSIENYSLMESFYMSIITITTVGFGEVKPLSPAGKGFTTFLILIGFVSLAFMGRAIVELFFERIWNISFKLKNMRSKISKLKDHYIVCGFGRVGQGAVEYLSNAGVEFVIIEHSHEQCIELQKENYLFIEGDASRENILLDAKIKKAKGLLALLNNDPDNLFLVLTARELNPTLNIVSRAEDPGSEKKIIRAGADKVITPYINTGKQIANMVLNENDNAFFSSEFNELTKIIPQWIEIKTGSDMLGKTIAFVAEEMNRTVYGLRRVERDFIFPDENIVLKDTDKLLVLDDETIDKNTTEFNTKELKKLVIVDDNPIILHLYARLFQKNGFFPITAINGEEGFELIKQEKPVAAVIDYMLPVLSGIELCSLVRTEKELDAIKLILFTGDKEEETNKRALQAGADEVVIKSPDAHEIINTVINNLK